MARRVRLPGLPGSAEFMAVYQAALEGPAAFPVGAAKRSKPGSVSTAIAAYYGANEFTSLAAGTQRARRSILESFRNAHGDKPIALLPPKFIMLTLSQMRPSVARNWFKAIRALMQFAISLEMRADDPTQGLRLPRVKSDGVHTWSEGEIEQFEGALCRRHEGPARARAPALHRTAEIGHHPHGPSTHPRRRAHGTPRQDRRAALDPGAQHAARRHRCHARQPSHLPDD
jgi:hypothetical protein